jgi:hypothetical protein
LIIVLVESEWLSSSVRSNSSSLWVTLVNTYFMMIVCNVVVNIRMLSDLSLYVFCALLIANDVSKVGVCARTAGFNQHDYVKDKAKD